MISYSTTNLEDANTQFALDAYLPVFNQKKSTETIEKTLKLEDIRKHLKKIQTHVLIDNDNKDALDALLAIIVSRIVPIDVKVWVSAKANTTAWQCFTITANLNVTSDALPIDNKRLIQAAENIGHFHSKPLNTLSSVQFCNDSNFPSQSNAGFTADQLNHETAHLSISGGSNAFSAFYAILITRINRISMAEHLIGTSQIAQTIQLFFKKLLTLDDFQQLQHTLKKSLSKTANAIGHLHVMSKQIVLPITDDKHQQCNYIAITPIINPTVFAALNNKMFYIKNQSLRFMNIPLGGDNASNAGTAVGEVSGQNSRLKMVFPVTKTKIVKQRLVSLAKNNGFFWSPALKQKITNNLLAYEANKAITNEKQKTLLKNTVQLMLIECIEQLHAITLYLQSLDPESYQQEINQLQPAHRHFFNRKKNTEENHAVWLTTLKYSVQNLKKLEDEIDFSPVIREIEHQFADYRHQYGGF